MLIRVTQKSTKAGELGPDVVRAIGESCDVIVVTCGTAEDIGVDLEPFYSEVMRANLAKEGGAIDENGKLQKPPGWTKPDLQSVFDRIVNNWESMTLGNWACSCTGSEGYWNPGIFRSCGRCKMPRTVGELR